MAGSPVTVAASVMSDSRSPCVIELALQRSDDATDGLGGTKKNRALVLKLVALLSRW